MRESKRSNFLKAITITVALGGLVGLVAYPSGSPLGRSFDLFVAMIAVHYVALAYGTVVILLRIFRVMKDNHSFLYILAGTINLSIAVTGIVLFYQDLANTAWLYKIVINLLIGFFILVDMAILPFKTNTNK